MEEQRKDCQGEFIRIWERLGKGDKQFEHIKDGEHSQDISIRELQINVASLINSIGKLTTAIWGVVLAASATGIGFIIWYIQGH